MISRRELFLSCLQRSIEAAARALDAAQPAEPQPRRPAFLRPPGALPEEEFRERCTRCDACLIACPREAVRRAGRELGAANEGTPVIVPELQPCWLCAELPCIAACEPGALAPLDAPEEARMASVRVQAQLCFAARGSPCEVCAERCPTRPRAVRCRTGEAPVLDLERCTGCAVCAWLCPAQAIELVELAPAVRRSVS